MTNIYVCLLSESMASNSSEYVESKGFRPQHTYLLTYFLRRYIISKKHICLSVKTALRHVLLMQIISLIIQLNIAIFK